MLCQPYNIMSTVTFLQLYNLSQDAERKEFLDKLFNFMQSKGEKTVIRVV